MGSNKISQTATAFAKTAQQAESRAAKIREEAKRVMLETPRLHISCDDNPKLSMLTRALASVGGRRICATLNESPCDGMFNITNGSNSLGLTQFYKKSSVDEIKIALRQFIFLQTYIPKIAELSAQKRKQRDHSFSSINLDLPSGARATVKVNCHSFIYDSPYRKGYKTWEDDAQPDVCVEADLRRLLDNDLKRTQIFNVTDQLTETILKRREDLAATQSCRGHVVCNGSKVAYKITGTGDEMILEFLAGSSVKVGRASEENIRRCLLEMLDTIVSDGDTITTLDCQIPSASFIPIPRRAAEAIKKIEIADATEELVTILRGKQQNITLYMDGPALVTCNGVDIPYTVTGFGEDTTIKFAKGSPLQVGSAPESQIRLILTEMVKLLVNGTV